MKYLGVVLALLLGLLWGACAGDPTADADAGWEFDGDWRPPDYWEPGDKPAGGCVADGGDGCSQAGGLDCADDPCIHGLCLEVEDSSDYCQCHPGYAGLLCDSCAPGFEAEGLTCVAVDLCGDAPCVHGTCRVDGADETCDCDSGYTGEYCDRCAPGYHVEGTQCVSD